MFGRHFAIILVVALSAISIQAQSGRRNIKPPPAAPIPTPTPEPTPTPKEVEAEPELFFFLGADRYGSMNYSLPFGYYDAVVRGCGDRLRTRSSANVDKTDRSFSRGEAIKKAKAESRSFVVWLNLTLDSMARSYDDLVVEFTVFAPGTAKVVTNGRSYLNGNRAGPIVMGPGSTGRLYREQLLLRAGEDAADRILKAMHMDVNIPRVP